jgi:hypothetical protein
MLHKTKILCSRVRTIILYQRTAFSPAQYTNTRPPFSALLTGQLHEVLQRLTGRSQLHLPTTVVKTHINTIILQSETLVFCCETTITDIIKHDLAFFYYFNLYL